MKEEIKTNQAPKAIGPYSQAVNANGFLFVSGQIPINPETGKIIESNVSKQAVQIFSNIKAILEQANADFNDVVNATVYLTDMNYFSIVNAVYAKYFNGEVLPARCAIQIGALPKNALLEISCTAILNDRD